MFMGIQVARRGHWDVLKLDLQTGRCKQCMGLRNHTPGFCKNSKRSYTRSHLSMLHN